MRFTIWICVLLALVAVASGRGQVSPEEMVTFINSLETTESIELGDDPAVPFSDVHVIGARQSIELPRRGYARIVGESEIYSVRGGIKYVIVRQGDKKVLKEV